jgi:hypothetical protein
LYRQKNKIRGKIGLIRGGRNEEVRRNFGKVNVNRK